MQGGDNELSSHSASWRGDHPHWSTEPGASLPAAAPSALMAQELQPEPTCCNFRFFFLYSKWSHDPSLVLGLGFSAIHHAAFSHLFPIYLFCHLGQSVVVLTRLSFVTLEPLVQLQSSRQIDRGEIYALQMGRALIGTSVCGGVSGGTDGFI